MPFGQKTQNFLSPTKMAKVLLKKKIFWQLCKKNSKIYKVWKRFVKKKGKKIQNPPERIKIASREKYFQSPSFERKKILICCYCLEKKYFFKIIFLFLFRILTSFVKVLPKPYFLLPKCWSFNASCKQVVKLCAIKMSVASLAKHRIYEIQKKMTQKL